MSFDWWPPDGPWPTSPGGIRGPDNRTLTDLHNLIALTNTELAALVLQVQGLAGSIGQLAADVRYLAGEPENRPADVVGLPHLLRRTIGPPLPNDTNVLINRLFSISTSAAAISSMLNFAGFSQVAGGNAFNAIKAIADHGNKLSTIDSNAAALALVLGTIAADPNGSTIKDLLRSIDTNMLRAANCCEEGETGQPLNDPPSPSLCSYNGVAAQVRAVALVPIDPLAVGGMVGETTIGIDFGSGDGVTLTYDGVASAQANLPVYVVGQNNFQTLNGCIEWDLTGNNAPPWVVERMVVEQVGGEWRATLAQNIGTAFANGPDAGDWWIGYNGRVGFRLRDPSAEGSTPPGRNFWLSYGPDLA